MHGRVQSRVPRGRSGRAAPHVANEGGLGASGNQAELHSLAELLAPGWEQYTEENGWDGELLGAVKHQAYYRINGRTYLQGLLNWFSPTNDYSVSFNDLTGGVVFSGLPSSFCPTSAVVVHLDFDLDNTEGNVMAGFGEPYYFTATMYPNGTMLLDGGGGLGYPTPDGSFFLNLDGVSWPVDPQYSASLEPENTLALVDYVDTDEGVPFVTAIDAILEQRSNQIKISGSISISEQCDVTQNDPLIPSEPVDWLPLFTTDDVILFRQQTVFDETGRPWSFYVAGGIFSKLLSFEQHNGEDGDIKALEFASVGMGGTWYGGGVFGNEGTLGPPFESNNTAFVHVSSPPVTFNTVVTNNYLQLTDGGPAYFGIGEYGASGAGDLNPPEDYVYIEAYAGSYDPSDLSQSIAILRMGTDTNGDDRYYIVRSQYVVVGVQLRRRWSCWKSFNGTEALMGFIDETDDIDIGSMEMAARVFDDPTGLNPDRVRIEVTRRGGQVTTFTDNNGFSSSLIDGRVTGGVGIGGPGAVVISASCSAASRPITIHSGTFDLSDSAWLINNTGITVEPGEVSTGGERRGRVLRPQTGTPL